MWEGWSKVLSGTSSFIGWDIMEVEIKDVMYQEMR